MPENSSGISAHAWQILTNETPHISFEEAKDIILNSDDPNDTSAVYLALSNAANGYAGKYPYDSIQRVGYEFWLSDDGSEFIVAFCSYAGEQDIIEYVYFRYDADAGQYAWQYIPERTRGAASAADSTETSVPGGDTESEESGVPAEIS